MIESNIKKIIKTQKVSRTKTAQELKTLGSRLSRHDKQFQSITSSISLLPTQDMIQKMIEATIPPAIKTTVNGKIDRLTEISNTNTEKIDMVGQHLIRQDNAIEVINNKIKPVIGSLEWLKDTKTLIVYTGIIAGAIYGILRLLTALKIIN